MSVTIEADGLIQFSDRMSRMPDITAQAMRLAINQSADRRALPLARDEIGTQVNFPKGYLNADRLSVTKRATDADLEAVISGRDRPTSLVRFLVGTPVPGRSKGGLTVRVKPGTSRVMKSAFVVNLRSGNLGLVLRLKEGKGIEQYSRGAAPFGPNLYLLYGPSVNQVFQDVAEKVLNPTAEYLADEFLRQFARLSGD